MPTNEQTLSRDQWIAEAYSILCKQLGSPTNATEEKHLRDWATSMASGDECNYYAEGNTPDDAVWEEFQAAS